MRDCVSLKWFTWIFVNLCSFAHTKTKEDVLRRCKWRLAALNGTTMELLHGQDRVPDDGTRVRDWPGLQPTGEITEYQLIVTR
eukprot:4451617-Amphidinium_carterae.1